ncbi:MAG: lipid A export permease/ATP-binding protein MsbA [Gammaproteobacteria bacterium]|nr:MAG: lipid A export permease/ATP-binding protein MsbA [Gammaproteobacteria bacterium]
MTDSSQASGLQIYRRLLGYVRPYIRGFALSVVGMLGLAITSTTFVALLKPLVDGGFVGKDPAVIRLVPIAVIGLFAFRGVASFTAEYMINWVGRRVIFDIRNALFAHMVHLPSKFYDEGASGTLIAKLIFDVEQLSQAATHAVFVIVRDGLTVVGVLAWMLYLNWKFTLILIVLTPFAAVVVRIMSQRLRKYSRMIQDSVGKISQIAQEATEGQRVVKAFVAQQFEIDSFGEANEQNRRRFMRRVGASAVGVAITVLLAATSVALVLYLAIAAGEATAGEFVSYTLAMGWMMSPIQRVARINEVIQTGIAAGQSAFGLIDEPPEPDPGDKEIEVVRGSIEYRNVGFRYVTAATPALSEVSFVIEPGETVALVGASGSGKSTVANLLPRFYVAASGEIRIDGVNINELRLENLRSHIAIVGQETILFDSTIRDNIAYGNRGPVDEQRIGEAAEVAHVTEFVNRLEKGLETTVGEKGLRLSGGQRQRIAIARAVYKNAPILVLDEATSALDSESERHVQAAMQALTQNRTTLVVAHRLATIENADRIVVLARGRIVETGTHGELLDADGVYAGLHRMQFSDHRN